MIKKFNEFLNEEIFFRGGEYVPDKYKVDNGVDGEDDGGMPYDIKAGDFITIVDFLSRTNAYIVNHKHKTYRLPAEVVFDMELRKTAETVKESYDNPTFTEWYQENKDSEILAEEYREYVNETKQMGEKPLTFRQWCKEKFEEE